LFAKKRIKTENDYFESLKRIEELWGAKKDTPEGDEFDLMVTLLEAYEMKHFPIAPPDPVDAILVRMEQMGMTKTDMTISQSN
jgi:HTH-type transcriptional regulator / antitoxin HigA